MAGAVAVFGRDSSFGRGVAVRVMRTAVAVAVCVAVGVCEAVRVAEAVSVAVLVSVAVDVLVMVSVGVGDPVVVGVEDGLVLVMVTVGNSTPGWMGPARIKGSHHDKTAMRTSTDSKA